MSSSFVTDGANVNIGLYGYCQKIQNLSEVNNSFNVPIVKIFKNTNLQDAEKLIFKVPLYFGKIL